MTEASKRHSSLGRPPYRIAGIPPGIISADDYDVTDEALEALVSLDALVEQLEALAKAARPIVESWDLHAADYLADLIDGEEQRILPARSVDEMIHQQARLAHALDASNPASRQDEDG